MAVETITSVRSQSGAGSGSANLHANEGEVELSASDLWLALDACKRLLVKAV